MKKYSLVLIIVTSIFIFLGVGCGITDNNPEYLSNSINYSNQASEIINSDSQEINMDKLLNLKTLALEEAKKVDIDKLNNHYDDFGNQWRDNYIVGLELFVSGIQEEDNEKSIRGQLLLDDWGDWYAKNIDQIKYK